MHAVNYPITTVAPQARESGISDPGELLPLEKNSRGLLRVLGLGGIVLALVLIGFLIGRFVAGPASANERPAGLGGFAESYLSTLLTRAGEGAEEVLIPYLGYSPDLTGLAAGSWYVSHTAVWSIEEIGPDRWAVVVAAEQLGLQEGGYVPTGTSFYTVEIDATATGFRAVSFPRQLPAPPRPGPPATKEPAVDSQLADTVAGFLNSRFSETESTRVVGVTLLDLSIKEAAEDHLNVEVDFLAVDTAGRSTPLTHQLTVSTIDWSVTDSDPQAVSQGSS